LVFFERGWGAQAARFETTRASDRRSHLNKLSKSDQGPHGRLCRSTVNGSNPIVRARNSGNVCPDSNMIAAYCPRLPCHGLAIVATKLSFSGGYRLLLKRGRSRLPLTFWPNRLILMSRSLMEAAKTPHVQLAQLKHLPPHQVCRQSYEVQQLSILAQRLFPHSNISMENKLIKDSN
jgi:hypothetical protein